MNESCIDNKRKWLPTISDLIDRLSIHQLKEVFISDHKEKYFQEMCEISHDIDILSKNLDVRLDGKIIHYIILLAQINTHIWYNESKARSGQDQDIMLLKLTHGLNGIRNRIMNRILDHIGHSDRQDYKIDCLASEFSSWDVGILKEGD